MVTVVGIVMAVIVVEVIVIVGRVMVEVEGQEGDDSGRGTKVEGAMDCGREFIACIML